MVNKVTSDTRVYTDVQSLQQLHAEVRKNPNAAKHEVAKQFEAMFLQMVMRSMRDANKAFASDIFGSDQMDFYQDIYDKQLTMTLSNTGIGIAAMIEKNIDQQSGKAVVAAPSVHAIPFSHLEATNPKAIPRENVPAAETLSTAINPVVDPVAPPLMAAITPEQSTFNNPEEFVKHLWPAAKIAAGMIGANPQVLIAQAALETNWGKKIIGRDSGQSSFNLFNIKADSTWNRGTTTMNTLEQNNGVLVKEKSTFRSYGSFMESFMDYAKFLKENNRYADALKKATDPKEFVHALQDAGYATDTNYADKILKIFSSRSFKDLMGKMQ